jgi:hypothetical protein
LNYIGQLLVERPSQEDFPMRLFTFSCLATLGTGLSAPALAEGSAVFGGPGQLAISGDMQVALQGESYSAPNGQTAPSSTTTAILAPAGDFFVIQGLSLGGRVLYAHTEIRGLQNSADTFGIGPRIGYNIALGDTFSVWPKILFQYQTLSFSNNGGSLNSTSIGAFVPFLAHPVKHFFLGLGPEIQTELSNSVSLGNSPSVDGVKTTTYGIMFVVGGWLSVGG